MCCDRSSPLQLTAWTATVQLRVLAMVLTFTLSLPLLRAAVTCARLSNDSISMTMVATTRRPHLKRAACHVVGREPILPFYGRSNVQVC